MDIATLTPGKEKTPEQWGWDKRALLRQWNSASYRKQGTGGDFDLRWLDKLMSFKRFPLDVKQT